MFKHIPVKSFRMVENNKDGVTHNTTRLLAPGSPELQDAPFYKTFTWFPLGSSAMQS